MKLLEIDSVFSSRIIPKIFKSWLTKNEKAFDTEHYIEVVSFRLK